MLIVGCSLSSVIGMSVDSLIGTPLSWTVCLLINCTMSVYACLMSHTHVSLFGSCVKF